MGIGWRTDEEVTKRTDPPSFTRGRSPRRRRRGPARWSSGVDEDTVDGAEAPGGLLDDSVHAVRCCEVGCAGEGPLAQLSGGFLKGVGAAGYEEHPAASGDQVLGDGASEPAARAADHEG
jgi:hypothetical protein